MPIASCRDLDQIAATSPDDVEIASVRIALQNLLNCKSQALHAGMHVGLASGDSNPNAARNRDHRRRSSSRTHCSASTSPSRSTRTRQPPPSSISMIRPCTLWEPNTATRVTAPLWRGRVGFLCPSKAGTSFRACDSDGAARARDHRLPRSSGPRRTATLLARFGKIVPYPMLTAVAHDRTPGICRSAGTIRILARLPTGAARLTDAHSHHDLRHEGGDACPKSDADAKQCQATYRGPYWACGCFSKLCHVLSARGQPGTVIAN